MNTQLASVYLDKSWESQYTASNTKNKSFESYRYYIKSILQVKCSTAEDFCSTIFNVLTSQLFVYTFDLNVKIISVVHTIDMSVYMK